LVAVAGLGLAALFAGGLRAVPDPVFPLPRGSFGMESSLER
jgi:hypothetical protein